MKQIEIYFFKCVCINISIEGRLTSMEICSDKCVVKVSYKMEHDLKKSAAEALEKCY